MTKQELVEKVHDAAADGHSRRLTAEVIDATFEAITKSIIEDGKFFYPGFGTFTIKERKARTGRNPRTGDEIKIPASKTVGFKVAAGLKGQL
ncbi:MAG: HU family DNA-binding protein [Myxococcales bacterium]|nr:HU family DNA-binding protein [Myxococcales bacterium]MCB9534923.1 HU family DNA-binding protein [Myxococcales bacterium]